MVVSSCFTSSKTQWWWLMRCPFDELAVFEAKCDKRHWVQNDHYQVNNLIYGSIFITSTRQKINAKPSYKKTHQKIGIKVFQGLINNQQLLERKWSISHQFSIFFSPKGAQKTSNPMRAWLFIEQKIQDTVWHFLYCIWTCWPMVPSIDALWNTTLT